MKTIRFESQEHENFFYSMLKRTGNTDSYHQAFFYCVGISDTTRRNVERIFDFNRSISGRRACTKGGRQAAPSV